MSVENERMVVPIFSKTYCAEVILSRLRHNYYCGNLFWVFDNYPSFEIRKEVLERWSTGFLKISTKDEAEWIEKRILDLGDEEQESRSGFWKELLSCYLFCIDRPITFLDPDKEHEAITLISRAIEFSIGLTQKEYFAGDRGPFLKSDILKIITNKLKRTPEVYVDLQTQNLKPFLESFIIREYQSRFGIINYELVDVKRVISCALAVEDWSFSVHLKKLLSKMRQSWKKDKNRDDLKGKIEFLNIETYIKEMAIFFEEQSKK